MLPQWHCHQSSHTLRPCCKGRSMLNAGLTSHSFSCFLDYTCACYGAQRQPFINFHVCYKIKSVTQFSGSAATDLAITAACPCVILQVLGLHSLRFFSSLMPVLLGWCRDPQQATCIAALEALHEVIKHTWPRMPAHASFLWSQLQHISTLHPQMQVHESQGHKDDTDAQIRNCIVKIANMLYLCGGSLFQKSMCDAWKETKDPTADVMLQSIELYISAPEQHL